MHLKLRGIFITILFIAGHGEWYIPNGYCNLPKGCSISFYTEFSKNMFTVDMMEILKGTYTGIVQQKIEQFKICPNYTIHPDPKNHLSCNDIINQRNSVDYELLMFTEGAKITLSELFYVLSLYNIQLDMIFSCCRSTCLRDNGGKSIGFNAAQGTLGDRDCNGRFILKEYTPRDKYYFNLSNVFNRHLL